MAFTVRSGTCVGVDGFPVEVEVDLVRRLPCIVIVGLPDCAVRESADRVRSAITGLGHEMPKRRVVVNLAPADLRKTGTAFDLPIALGILAADGLVATDKLDQTVFLGELSLEGELKTVRGALPLALMARATGARRIVLPAVNAPEAAVASGIEVLSARSLGEVCAWLDGRGTLQPPGPPGEPDTTHDVDMAEVRGQARARRALEVAAAGGHNLLFMGSPGCGKTMLAARMPTILPALTFEEAVDITRVYSVAGLLPEGAGLVTRRPFRAPHHSVSVAGMIGNAQLQPGEVSLAHNGVLFLDEVAEFQRGVLELLRSPLEDRKLQLVRAKGSVTFPASISLVAAANPCACGFLGHPRRPCACNPGLVSNYRARLSGPLMDRIDLQVWVQPVEIDQLVRDRKGESSASVRERVETARRRQRERYRDASIRCNAELRGDHIRQAADPEPQAVRLLQDTVSEHALSARSWTRLLKVARTIADLEGAPRVQAVHVLEASTYRLPLAGDSTRASAGLEISP